MARRKRRSGCLPTLLMGLALFGAVFMGLKVVYPLQYADIVQEEAARYGHDPYLVAAMIHTESKFRPTATSAKDAVGLMQITEPTWLWIVSKIGGTDRTWDRQDPKDNIQLGLWYLDYLKKSFASNDEQVVLAAYNAGEGNVRKWLLSPEYSTDGIHLTTIPFPETKAYIERVDRARKVYQWLYWNTFTP